MPQSTRKTAGRDWLMQIRQVGLELLLVRKREVWAQEVQVKVKAELVLS